MITHQNENGKKIYARCIAFLILCGAITAHGFISHHTFAEETSIRNKQAVTVINIIGGDLIRVSDENHHQETTVRLLGIDVPECLSRSEFTDLPSEEYQPVSDLIQEKVHPGDTIYLEYDQTEKDRFQHTLAYVYLSDGTMLQEWILNNGYGYTHILDPDTKYETVFTENEQQAQTNHSGIWGGKIASGWVSIA